MLRRWTKNLLPLIAAVLPRLTVTFADCGTVVCHASQPDGTPGACCAFPKALFNVRHVRVQACSTGILRQLLAAASCGQLPALLASARSGQPAVAAAVARLLGALLPAAPTAEAGPVLEGLIAAMAEHPAASCR